MRERQHSIVAATLISRIAAGEYAVGGLLPTEHQLSEEFGRSRQTIREALRQLHALDLVSRQPGIGTRVMRETPSRQHAYSINSMHELEHYANEVRLRIDRMERVAVDAEAARALDCAEGATWLYLRGVRFRQDDGVPIGASEVYLRAHYPGVEQHLSELTGAIHVMLEREYDVRIEEIRQDARSILLSADDARRLAATEHGPATEVVRRYYLSQERLVLLGRIVYPADRFSLSMSFRRTARG